MKQRNLILILTIMVTIGIAQVETNDILGYVKDVYSGESLSYTNLGLIGTDRGTSSNADGYFVIVNANVGTCSLQVSYIGYETKVVRINNDPKVMPILIELKRKAIDFGQVEVVADAYEVFKSADNVSQMSLNPRELQTLPSLGEIDIFRALQLLPGISGVSDGKAGLYVRGGTPDQNMVILDGMTVYHVNHFFGMFSAFNADAIKDVQVYKGGFPAKYGGRLSSIVELTGKKGGDVLQMSFGANLLSANFSYEVPFWDQKGSWLISARRSYTDILQSPLYNSMYEFVTGEEAASGSASSGGMGGGMGGGAIQQEAVPSFYFYDLNSKLTLNPTYRDIFSLSFYSGRDYLDKSLETDMQNQRFTTSDGSEFQTRVDENLTDWGNIGGSLKWGHQWGTRGFSNLLVSNSIYKSEYERNLSMSGSNVVGVDDSTGAARGLGTFAQDEFNMVNDLTFSFDNQWQLNEKHKLEFGTFIADITTDYEANVRDTISILDVNSKSRSYAIYLQDHWKLTPLFDITFGLRSTYHNQTAAFYHAPRLSFGWRLSDKLKLKGAWGEYYQFINNVTNENVLQGSNDFWLSADENLVPAYSEHTILGLSYETPKYLFEVEGYYKTLENLLEFSRRFQADSDYLNYFYFGSGISKGLEFLAQKKFGTITGWISYTLAQVENTFPKLNDGNPFPASHDRRHELQFVGSYKLGPWNFSLTNLFSTGNAYTAPESQYYLQLLDGEDYSYIHVGEKNAYRLPDYHRLDLSASRKFESEYFNWEVGLSIYNVLNHDNISYRDYDLDVTPIIVSDVTMLGITPTIFIKTYLK